MREVRLGSSGLVARVDDEDYLLVAGLPWYLHRCKGQLYARYEYRDETGRHGRYMHNLIMGAFGVDHRDHDGLNNQRYNLRVADQHQNGGNMRSKGGTSAFKGVDACYGKWRAQIHADGKKRHLGLFATETDAARAYDAAARESFGEFAFCNFPDEKPRSGQTGPRPE